MGRFSPCRSGNRIFATKRRRSANIMRTVQDDRTDHGRSAAMARWLTAFAIALMALAATAPTAAAQSAAPGTTEPAPRGLPPPNFPTSPHRGVIDGWTGKPIPCRCRFEGKQLELGTIVCMSTHVGTVLTRCDIVGNNTSWVPSREPCVPDVGS
jgi:hypothetical protein